MSTENIAEMSDEDFAKLDEATLLNAGAVIVDHEDGTTNDDTKVVEVAEEGTNEDQSQGITEPVIEPVVPIDDAGNKVEDTSKVEDKEPKQEAKVDEVVKPAAKEEKDEPKQAEPATPEAQLAALFAPIKANGREHKFESVEEIRQLASMGLGFNKKMGELKRAKRIEAMLDKNEIDETRLSFLIDVALNKPEAISKLIQESGIDALELGVDVAEKYTPSVHSVSDKEMAIDEVLSDLKGSPTVAKTLNVVTKEWDKASRDSIADEPEVLKAIDAHMQNGVYDLISAEMERQGALGKLKGLSNIQAYQQVGDTMNAQGKFAHLFSGSSTQSQQTTPVAPVVVQPKLKQAEDDEQRAARRKAASGTPPAASVTKPAPTKSLLDMSPEEFANFKPTSI